MGRVVAIGDPVQVHGWALAGVDVRPATSDDEIRTVWQGLPPDVDLVIATTDSARALRSMGLPQTRLLAVLPP